MRGVAALTFMALGAGCGQADLAFATELLDLGPVRPGVERLRQIELINRSGATLTLAGAESNNPNFKLLFLPRMTFAPQQRRPLTVRHLAPEGTTEPQLAELRAWTDDGLVALAQAASQPTTPDCTLPTEVDFGSVPIGSTSTLELSLVNSTGAASGATVEAPLSTHEAFRIRSGWVPLQPGEEVLVPISFTPGFARAYAAAVPVRRHPLCETQLLRLLGIGVERALSTEPGAMSWSIDVGRSEVQVITLVNVLFSPVELTTVEVRQGSASNGAFRITRFPLRLPAAKRDGALRVIPGTATIEVAFSADAAGPSAGMLMIGTDVAAEALLGVPLHGFGVP